MGLPTKKQLQKHHRGTRKALDTLDALSDADKQLSSEVEKSKNEESNKDTVSTVKKTVKKPPPATKSKKEKPVKEALTNDTVAKQVAEEKAVVVPETITEVPKPTEKKPALKKSEIKLDMVDDKSEAPVKQETDIPKNRAEEAIPTPSEEMDIGQLDDLDVDTQKDRFLSFRIGKEDYAIEIRFVTEIIVMHPITEVPDTPPFIKGVINLRGKVIPVMDVRERFNLEKREYDNRTCIVVVDVDEITVGLIVDTVNEVIDIPESNIDSPPATHSGIESNYISGMGKVGDKVKILLDVKNVLILDVKNNI
jgi:purine-binding chemotaxis protein CheW